MAFAALRLARALGFEGDRLEEIGLAALLHDVGHLVPAAGEGADERRQRHTVRGAARLAAVEGLSEIVVVAAYEHHLRFDGAGRVTLHRDYWDAAEELYAKLPLLGCLMRGLARMARA